jgi:hypothetical protein
LAQAVDPSDHAKCPGVHASHPAMPSAACAEPALHWRQAVLCRSGWNVPGAQATHPLFPVEY